MEISIDKILRRRAYPPTIGAVATSSGRGCDQTFLSHQASHHFLRDEQLVPYQGCADSTIAVTAVIALKDVCDDATRARMPVSDKPTCTVIEVGAASKPPRRLTIPAKNTFVSGHKPASSSPGCSGVAS
jgi:hypothetical protein